MSNQAWARGAAVVATTEHIQNGAHILAGRTGRVQFVWSFNGSIFIRWDGDGDDVPYSPERAAQLVSEVSDES